MIEVTAYRDRAVMVLGLGRSGLAAAVSLREGGATVVTWDDDEAARANAKRQGFPVMDPDALDWSNVDALVPSPGIPLTHPKPHPAVAKARTMRCEILGDVELLARTQTEARYVGVTGTNGKSTTTALIGHLLQAGGRRIEIGGNLGAPVLELAPLGLDGIYVLELSSFQLDLLYTTCLDVAVLLNIAPDHLERHGGLDGYIAVKRGIFGLLGEGATAVIGIDDPHCRAIRDGLAGGLAVVPISAKQTLEAGVSARGGALNEHLGETMPAVDLTRILSLRGEHNWQNAAAAWAAVRAIGLKPEYAAHGLQSFVNLPHRQEPIAVANGIHYVNDSKATNANATLKALAAFDTIYWIAGGRPKADGIASLAPYFPRVRHAFLIGEAMESFAQTLGGKVPYHRSGDLKTALREAHAMAQAEGGKAAVVLFSPGCASYDQWKNFEARGDAFRSLVLKLPGAKACVQVEGGTVS